MKRSIVCVLLSVMVLMLFPGCGGDGGSGSGTGTISMDITDAKPLIAGDPTELWLVFEEVLVHKSGGGWVSLDLPETPFEINLLAFSHEEKTELVTPTLVTMGHITQIRFVISRAYMVFDGNRDPVDIDLDVPSGILRTDKQFDWWLENGGAVDLTVHFDLSQSIVQTGEGEYKLKPVIHLFNNSPQEAATICGTIAPGSFDTDSVDVSVIWHGPKGDETYTQVIVDKKDDTVGTEFCIFWLVPKQDYTVQIDNGVDPIYQERVYAVDLEPGASYDLHDGTEIVIPSP